MKYRSLLLLICVFLAHKVVNAQPLLSFSHEHGFYSSSFQLEIESDTPNSMIRYTLDGSDPRYSRESFSGTSPATITINPYITTGRVVSPGIAVRACAIAGSDTSRVYSQTYIFLSEVKYQDDVSPDLSPYWPTSSNVPSTFSPNLVDWMQNMSHFQNIKLGVDRSLVYRDEYYAGFERDLLSIPTLSLVTDPANLFDDSTGIYINGTWSGRSWERSASLEMIEPSGGGFQVNTGIRIRGGWSSTGANPKHAFRLYFRDEYGDAKLEFPLFGIMGTDKFDKIDLRCEQNTGWQAGNNSADYIHDAFSREIQRDMNQPYTRSSYYHLYLNGMYWGLYETQERASASFAESYMGGDKDNYDVVKSSAGSIDYPPYTLEATDGELASSKALWDIAIKGFNHDNYMEAQGLNPDGSKNEVYPKYLDVDNLISYMIVIYFSANRDGPAMLSATDSRINNFFGIYNREKPDGFKYCIHDNETAYTSVNDNITNAPFAAGWTFESFNPMWLNQQLMLNTDYKQRFADLAYSYLTGNGVLTTEKNKARFQSRVDMIDEAIVGESARWGGRTLSKEGSWIPAINRMQEVYFSQRTDIVFNQFYIMGWLNNLIPPSINASDVISGNHKMLAKNNTIHLVNSNASGILYYTTDNTDPRVSGGGLSDKAIAYSMAIPVEQTVFLKARIKDGDEWSPLYATPVMKNEGLELLISEISYNPYQQIIEEDTLSGSSLEFIEIKNTAHTDIDISGYTLSDGISYEFPLGTIIKGDSLIVLASDIVNFEKLYHFSPLGQYRGNLNNEKEKIVLRNACGALISSIEYNREGVWFDAADGAGYTLVASSYWVNQLSDMQPNWRISTNWLGSPGEDDPEYTIRPIVFNEVLANSKYPFVDYIELKNTGSTPIDLSNWFLTDEKDTPNKWPIPQGTTIAPGGLIVFYEGHYIGDSLEFALNEFGNAFALSKGGETIYLFSKGENGTTGSYVTEYVYGATDENTSYGKYTSYTGNEYHLQLEGQSPERENGNARLSPIIFKYINYHPVDGNFEYLVLRNRSDSTVQLFDERDPRKTWRIKGIDFEFPGGVSIGSGDSIFIVEKMLHAEVFRSVLNLSANAKIFNYAGKLSNGGETISIEKPLFVESDSTSDYKYITLEEIGFNDKSPWPTNADGNGYILRRKQDNTFGNDASNWTSIYKALPVAIAGNNARIRLNSTITLDGSTSYDPSQLSLTYEWKLISSPSGSSANLSGSRTATPSIICDKVGNYLFSLVVDNGRNKSIPAYVSIMGTPNIAPTTENYPRTYRINLDQHLQLGAFDCTDANYDRLTYTWNLLEKPGGSIYELTNLTEKTFTFIPDMAGTYRFTLNSFDGELTGKEIQIKVIVSDPTGREAIAFGNTLSVYPNPVVDEAFVELNIVKETNASLYITGISGKVLSRINLGILHEGNSIIPVDFSTLERGIYIITVKTDDFTGNKKVYYVSGN